VFNPGFDTRTSPQCRQMTVNSKSAAILTSDLTVE
jgi:hypothetical protein